MYFQIIADLSRKKCILLFYSDNAENGVVASVVRFCCLHDSQTTLKRMQKATQPTKLFMAKSKCQHSSGDN